MVSASILRMASGCSGTIQPSKALAINCRRGLVDRPSWRKADAKSAPCGIEGVVAIRNTMCLAAPAGLTAGIIMAYSPFRKSLYFRFASPKRIPAIRAGLSAN